jgi:hypothetical protein
MNETDDLQVPETDTAQKPGLPWRQRIEASVHRSYRVDLKAVFGGLGITVLEGGLLKFPPLGEYTREELVELASGTIAFAEYVGARQAMVQRVVVQQEQQIEATRAKLLKDLSAQMAADTGKAPAENKLRDLVKGHPDITAKVNKLADYETYDSYLGRILKSIDSLHFLAKSLLAGGQRREP